MSENPLSPDLARLLSGVLLVLEGIRRDADPGPEDWLEAEEALDALAEHQQQQVPPGISTEVAELLEEAGDHMEGRDVEGARQALLKVGQAFDAWMRRRR